jgi:prepilin signal peptidase PulO-like enzyme (type II secretory pathway)
MPAVFWVTYFFVFSLGLCIGSFLNCAIYRLERKESFVKGRSYCPHCKHVLIWLDLVPVVSFLFLGGKCRYCHKKISLQYPLIEIITAIMFLLIFNFQVPSISQFSIIDIINLVFLWYVVSSLITIFIYDLKHYLIPDIVLFPAIMISFLYRCLNISNLSLFRTWSLGFWIFIPLINYLVASVLASAFFLVIFIVSKGRWMGFGDVKLAILLGLLVGFPNILVALFLSFLFGAIIGVLLIFLQKKGLKSEMPFAPFLILGTFLALLWGQEIIQWYTHFLVI